MNDLVFRAIKGGVDTQDTGMTSMAGDPLVLKGIDSRPLRGAHYTFATQAQA